MGFRNDCAGSGLHSNCRWILLGIRILRLPHPQAQQDQKERSHQAHSRIETLVALVLGSFGALGSLRFRLDFVRTTSSQQLDRSNDLLSYDCHGELRYLVSRSFSLETAFEQ